MIQHYSFTFFEHEIKIKRKNCCFSSSNAELNKQGVLAARENRMRKLGMAPCFWDCFFIQLSFFGYIKRDFLNFSKFDDSKNMSSTHSPIGLFLFLCIGNQYKCHVCRH